MKRNVIIEIICFLFIVLFFYAAGSKLLNYKAFVGQIGKSPLLTEYATWMAWLIPVTELVVVGLLVVPRWRKPGLYASFTLMALFTLYIAAILIFTDSKDLPCSCGGVLNSLSWKQHLIFNVFFTALAWAGIHVYATEEKKQHA